MIFTKCGRWHAEQDTEYEPERDCNGVWRRTKRVSRPTWTIYERVGSPSYQTPQFFMRDEAAARAKLSELGEISHCAFLEPEVVAMMAIRAGDAAT